MVQMRLQRRSWAATSVLMLAISACSSDPAPSADDLSDVASSTVAVVPSSTVAVVPSSTVALSALEPCQIAEALSRTDQDLRKAEPFAYVKRDPLIVELRHLMGLLRTRSWVSDGDLWEEVFSPTSLLERADFSESGLLTAAEQSAAAELSTVLQEHCGSGLPGDGLLLAGL